MRRFVEVTVLMLIASLAGCQAPGPDAPPLSDEDMAAIGELDAQLVAAALEADWAGAAAVMAEDIVFMPPNMPVLVGSAVWLEWVKSLDLDYSEATFSTLEIEGQGTLAYLRGEYTEAFTIGDAASPTREAGKYLAIVRKQPGGSWLITHWMWNLDTPLPRASAPNDSTVE